MREFIIVLVSIIGIGGIVAILLFMLIFPLVNKLFMLNIPCFHGIWDEIEIKPIIKRETKPKDNREENIKTKNRTAKRTDDLNSQRVVKSDPVKSTPVKSAPPKSSPPKQAYYDDRSVPTVKIPPLAKAPEKEMPLTLAKIEAATRKTTVMIDGQTYMENNMEQKVEKPKPRKEDVDRVIMEKKLEEQREKLKKKMAEGSKKPK